MMKERVQNAINVATEYRKEHQGNIPVLVIAHGTDETFTVIGKFRTDERGGGKKTRDDQKTFVGIMRTVFQLKGVTSYEIITKPEINNSAIQLTQNLLSVFVVDEHGAKGDFFEIEDEELIPCYSGMEVDGWFANLLPNDFKVTMDAKTQSRIERYVENCKYTPLAHMPVTSELDVMAAVLASL